MPPLLKVAEIDKKEISVCLQREFSWGVLTGELQKTIPLVPRLPLPAQPQQGGWEASAQGGGLALAVLLEAERGASV